MKKNIASKIFKNDWVWVLAIFAASMTIYLLQIQAWKATSPNYPPSNPVDNVIRLPEDRDEWLVRRANGVCPFNANEFNLKDPFAGFRDC